MIAELTREQIAAFEFAWEKAVSLPSNAARLEWIESLGDPLLAELLRGAFAEPVSIRDLQSRTRVGNYMLIERVGVGGFGEVWRARKSKDSSVEVALKVIRPQHLAGGEAGRFTEMFREEIACHARLRHEGIVRLLNAGSATLPGFTESIPYLVMELCEGQLLHSICRGRDIPSKLRCLIRICEAVQYAHRHDLMHLDLKPENILVSEDTHGLHPKVLDFGLARRFQPARPFLADRFGAGTLQYKAPEQIDPNLGGEDFRTDVHALGVLLFQLLTDRYPYPLKDGTVAEYKQYICEGPRLDAREFDEAIDPQLSEVIARATAIKKSQRYDSPERLAEELRKWLEANETGAPTQEMVAGFASQWNERKQKRAKIVALLLLLLVLTVTTALLSRHWTETPRGPWREFPMNVIGDRQGRGWGWHDIDWLTVDGSREGWLVGGSAESGGDGIPVGRGRMLYTTNGGKSWRDIDLASFESGKGTVAKFGSVYNDVGPLTSVFVRRPLNVDGKTWRTNAWVATATGVYFTREPGNSATQWRRITPLPKEAESYSYFNRLYLVRDNELYAYGWQGIAHWKEPGPWELQMGTYTYPISALTRAQGYIWAVGGQKEDEFGNRGGEAHGAIYRCPEGTTNWVAVKLDRIVLKATQSLYGIEDQRADIFAVGNEGLIIRGRPQGTNWDWRVLQSGVRVDLYAIASDRNLHVLWAVGEVGTILKSEDSGETWTVVPCFDQHGQRITETLSQIRFCGRDGAWILGLDLVLKYYPGG